MPELGTCESVLVLSTISLLLTALGLTATAGLRAYIPLLVLAVGPFIPNGCGSDLITLSPAFRDLFGVDTPGSWRFSWRSLRWANLPSTR